MLRTLFATLVLFSHSYPLTGNSEPLLNYTRCMSLGMVSVNFFFLLSGYLIAQSWSRKPNAGDFIRKRILRIYPGYLVAFAFSIIVGIIGSTPDGFAFCRSLFGENEKLFDGMFFLDGRILFQPIAFVKNPLPGIINGSLWTLQPELKCYLVVLILGLFHQLSRRLTVVVLLLTAYLLLMRSVLLFSFFEFSPWRLYTYFLVGVIAANAEHERFMRFVRNPVLILMSMSLLTLTAHLPLFFLRYFR